LSRPSCVNFRTPSASSRTSSANFGTQFAILQTPFALFRSQRADKASLHTVAAVPHCNSAY
jgi:hypothetical protein